MFFGALCFVQFVNCDIENSTIVENSTTVENDSVNTIDDNADLLITYSQKLKLDLVWFEFSFKHIFLYELQSDWCF